MVSPSGSRLRASGVALGCAGDEGTSTTRPGTTMRIAVLLTLLAAVGAGAQPERQGIQRLSWLQGCWETTAAGRTVEEIWTGPRGRSMLGVSRTVERGELTSYELVVVQEQGDRLVYIAHPLGQPSAEFLSTAVSENGVVFANLKHDFPQRISYERKGAQLHAWIEGTRDGRTRRIDFPYHRAACPAD